MGNIMLKAALKYREMGKSIIPAMKNKVALVGWASYQKQRPSVKKIESWWRKWPDAGIALVTGKVSGVTVVDADSEEGREALNEYLPDSLEIPVSKTPKGWHYWFEYVPGIPNAVRILRDCDVRNDGGYVIVPPSKNDNGTYTWLPEAHIMKMHPPVMPGGLEDILTAGISQVRSLERTNKNGLVPLYTNKKIHSRGGPNKPGDFSRLQVTSGDFKGFYANGRRDNDLFHAAHTMIKGGADPAFVRQTIEIISNSWGENSEDREIKKWLDSKIKSAIRRKSARTNSIAEDVRDFVVTSNGFFLTSDCFNRLQVTSRSEKKAVVLELLRLRKKGVIERHGKRGVIERHGKKGVIERHGKKGVIERHGKKDGCYRKIENECEPIDFMGAETETTDLWLPFNLHEMVEIMPGNIILVAGEPNAGKTALMLNIIRSNMRKADVHYFNSEMGGAELKKRLEKFDDIALSDWKFKAWERTGNFGDVIQSGKGKINIIDFLELHDNFYEVGGKLAEIHGRLKGAVAIVALQKNKGTDTGLSGFRSLEKPRLALAMEPGTLKIVKAKNWKTSDNPNGKDVRFKIVQGCNLIQTRGWRKPGVE